MLVTPRTTAALRRHRQYRKLRSQGFQPVSENGDPLWKFQRGAWQHRTITAVEIDPDGQRLWIKVSPP